MRKALLLFTALFALVPALAHAAPSCTPSPGRRAVAEQVRSACAEDGLSRRCADSLVHLDWHESGLTPALVYRRYRGVGQMNKNIAVRGDWRNAHDFTHRQIKYIRARYGCPCKALAHKHRTARRTRRGYIGGWY